MKRNMMLRNLRRSILRSMGRYIAIAMIIALGAGMFVGLRSTKMDMVATGQLYMDEQQMFDLRLLSSYGWDREQLEEIAALPGIAAAEGAFYSDLMVESKSGEELAVFRFYTIPETINQLTLLEGRMPEKPDECLADGFRNGKDAIGRKVIISEENSDTSKDQLCVDVFTIVGIVSTPLYMDMNRGSTSVGNGSISNYFFVPSDAFDVSYYTEIYARIPGSHEIYTPEYSDAMEAAAEELKPLLTPFAQQRMVSAKQEAEEAYREGQQKYEDGMRDYLQERADAVEKLEKARRELLNAEEEIREGEEELLTAEQEIADGWQEIEENRLKLEDAEDKIKSAESGGQWQLSSANSELVAKQAELEANAQELEAGLVQINTGLVEVNSGISQIKTGLLQIDAGLRPLDAMIRIADINAGAAQRTVDMLEKLGTPESRMENARQYLEECIAVRDGYEAQYVEISLKKQELNGTLEELEGTKAELEAKRQELLDAREKIREGRTAIQDGFREITRQRSNVDNQLISARQQVINGEAELHTYEKALREAEKELEEGRKKLEESKQTLADGWAEFNDSEAEAYEKFADAEAELAEAAENLQDAQKRISEITKTDVYVLDRNSNIGYNSLNSSSDIVAGVSKVFPVFFLLVAAMVCITTMTRMVDEERTQIGTMKALGYSNAAIVSKYLLYAGSGAVVGCALGIAMGSVIFPMVLWQAYKIMLFVRPVIELRFNLNMALWVIASYTAAMLAVTWYCCHRSLLEAPAELIRPKAPTVGKELFVEKISIWSRISFLNKVAIRNIFRYRQRMAMMLLGIGGCTALLMTGFGIRDSISKIVDVQFRDVTFYDVEVYFKGNQDAAAQLAFREKMATYSDDILFFYQVNGEIEANNRARDIYMIAAPEEVTSFIDFHFGTQDVPMPGKDEVLLTAGIAEMLGISVGDSIELRNPDMEVLHLKVSGLYENHVYNYAVVLPETIQSQWGRAPEQQMAFLSVRQGRNANVAGAAASGLTDVINVTVSAQQAQMVERMMAALDLVVIVVVVCAGILAVIVLYNLTNININERIREIATIKVLGFNAMETSMYVFKENLVLSVMGTLFGIPMGKLLLQFVISQIKIDIIWIKPLLSNESLLLSVILTVLSAVAVDCIFYFRLESINMAEALKSVE